MLFWIFSYFGLVFGSLGFWVFLVFGFSCAFGFACGFACLRLFVAYTCVLSLCTELWVSYGFCSIVLALLILGLIVFGFLLWTFLGFVILGFWVWYFEFLYCVCMRLWRVMLCV